MKSKTCTDCHTTKPIEEFYVKRDKRKASSYVDSVCKVCKRERSNRYGRENKDRYTSHQRAHRQRVKDAVFAAYGGYLCVCCGETEKAFLTLDHIENDGARFRRETFGDKGHRSAGEKTYRWLWKNGFPAGYQVLCMNCQFGKKVHGVCPHMARRNDYPHVGVGPSGPKRSTSENEFVH